MNMPILNSMYLKVWELILGLEYCSLEDKVEFAIVGAAAIIGHVAHVKAAYMYIHYKFFRILMTKLFCSKTTFQRKYIVTKY